MRRFGGALTVLALLVAGCGGDDDRVISRSGRSSSTSEPPRATSSSEPPPAASSTAAPTTAAPARPAAPSTAQATTTAVAPSTSSTSAPASVEERPLLVSAGWDDAYDVLIVRPDGTVVRNLTNYPPRSVAVASGGAWSPDGRSVVFESNVDRATGSQLFIVGADGSGLRRVGPGDGEARSPAFSPDGTRIAFAYRGRLHVMAADGSDLRMLVPPDPDEWPSEDGQPSWSPDGGALVFVRGYHEPRKPFPPDPGGPDDARFIGSYLYTVGSDGSGLRRLTPGTHRSDTSPDWSPDGTLIAYMDTSTDGARTVGPSLMRPDGSRRERLLAAGSSREGCSRPRWSPRATELALLCPVAKDNYVLNEVFRVRRDGTGLARVTTRPKGDEARSVDW